MKTKSKREKVEEGVNSTNFFLKESLALSRSALN